MSFGPVYLTQGEGSASQTFLLCAKRLGLNDLPLVYELQRDIGSVLVEPVAEGVGIIVERHTELRCIDIGSCHTGKYFCMRRFVVERSLMFVAVSVERTYSHRHIF